MSKASNPFVSVIIPVYNDPIRLKICLQVLEKQTYPENAYEVIAVDNGSDESIEPIVAGFNQAKASLSPTQDRMSQEIKDSRSLGAKLLRLPIRIIYEIVLW